MFEHTTLFAPSDGGWLAGRRTICDICSPLFWSNVYSLSVRQGRPGMFYWVVTALTAAQLALSRTLPTTV
eukprot:COSAG04_NODE_2726_length_3673_cov_1.904589_5_plen_70_part_00